jgi:hypothetical protein
MSQVIEVNFYNPQTQEKIHQCFTQVVSEEQHQEAIRLALKDFSVGHATLKEFTLVDPETFTKGYWRSMYAVVFRLDLDSEEREMYAVLWAGYKEKNQ